jgi:hypothetical protein
MAVRGWDCEKEGERHGCDRCCVVLGLVSKPSHTKI